MNKRQNRGITLIALIVTIIVMLILAGVTINIIVDGGLFKQVQDATIATRQGTVDDEVNIWKTNNKVSEYTKTGYEDPVTFINRLASNGTILNGEYNTEAKTITIGNRTWSLEGEDGPPIPEQFSYVEGTVETGFVIEDSVGNQFVWVPCTMDGAGGSVKYEKWDGTRTYVNARDTTDDTLPPGIDEKSQIIKYGGFYIARYEAGYDEGLTVPTTNATDRTPLSKKNTTVWNNIDYTTAKGRAQSMYNTESLQSGLVTGTQWDTTMAWLGKTDNTVIANSTDWGNYSNATIPNVTKYSDTYGLNYKTNLGTTKTNGSFWILATGNTEYTNRKNIYDLAGNVCEWTNEIFDSYRIIRGGGYDVSDGSTPAAYRGFLRIEQCRQLHGFSRFALYKIIG